MPLEIRPRNGKMISFSGVSTNAGNAAPPVNHNNTRGRNAVGVAEGDDDAYDKYRSVNSLRHQSSSTPSASQSSHTPAVFKTSDPAILPVQQVANAEIADQARVPWSWNLRGKATTTYAPSVTGKWWSRSEDKLGALTASKRRDLSHIGRIMETELGEQVLGRQRCAACQRLNQECWRYSDKGAQQISRPGDACARCRLASRPGGCSLSKRRPIEKHLPPASDPRRLLPFGGPNSSPPGPAGR
ncbi:hypothetical protein PVAG01_03985 [Phlyctema vagabunda]|uniref:Uncharacterized protein n=1 Tax=Phlyctema vagabunda TaxID=108571 RepID=A0ABR4PN06_9HELO